MSIASLCSVLTSKGKIKRHESQSISQGGAVQTSHEFSVKIENSPRTKDIIIFYLKFCKMFC
jgi:hypothetical protein